MEKLKCELDQKYRIANFSWTIKLNKEKDNSLEKLLDIS